MAQGKGASCPLTHHGSISRGISKGFHGKKTFVKCTSTREQISEIEYYSIGLAIRRKLKLQADDHGLERRLCYTTLFQSGRFPLSVK